MVSRVLMIAYHFPPVGTSSGLQRTLAFSRYLPEFGWEPLVLSCHPRAYVRHANDQLADIPSNITVRRAFALDTARHLAIRGKYPRVLAVPDRWISWWIGALVTGLRMIRTYRPRVIWSTYPIATAHLIGSTLRRISGLPWIADFRDPMVQEGYPRDPIVYRAFERIERTTVRLAARVVFTAPGAVKTYARRYPNRAAETWALIENGYDERTFDGLEVHPQSPKRPKNSPRRIVHSGVVYPSERDPKPLFDALADLKKAGHLHPEDLKIVFRGSGSEKYFRVLLRERQIEDLVQLEPRIPYREALAEMLAADALLVLQAANCNYQIPAKIYEYLWARRPILCLTDPTGDTAGVMRRSGIHTIARLDSAPDIARTLRHFLTLLKTDNPPVASEQQIIQHSRREHTRELAELLEQAAS